MVKANRVVPKPCILIEFGSPKTKEDLRTINAEIQKYVSTSVRVKFSDGKGGEKFEYSPMVVIDNLNKRYGASRNILLNSYGEVVGIDVNPNNWNVVEDANE